MAYNIIRDIRQPELPTDPTLRADVEQVLEKGYVILENAVSKEDVNGAIAEIDRLMARTKDKVLVGRNPFEGLNTNRIYALLNKSRVFDKFAILPRVLALNDYFLDPGYQITAMHTIQINPGEDPQGLHHDDAFCHMSRPRPPLGTAIMVALDDFTETNGATSIVPGSHKWDSVRRPQRSETQSMICPSGSVCYFIGTTWHGGGRNSSEKPRKSLTVQYCQPYIRAIENQILAVDPRRIQDMPPRIVDMMGYRVHHPFIGFADGLSPRRGAQRLLDWLRKPLDNDPPTFPPENTGRSKL